MCIVYTYVHICASYSVFLVLPELFLSCALIPFLGGDASAAAQRILGRKLRAALVFGFRERHDWVKAETTITLCFGARFS